MKLIKLYFTFLRLQIKTLAEYRLDFMIGMLSVLLGLLNTFLLTVVIFTQTESIVGYTIYELILMYGFYIMIKGFDHFYNDNIWSFAWNKIKDGRFITIMLRPIHPIFHLIIERMEISGVCEFLSGLVIILVVKCHLGLHLSVLGFLHVVVACICGVLVYFSVKLLFSAPAFWTVTCGEFMTAGLEIGNTSKYPIEMYRSRIIQTVLLGILPFPITAYFPTILMLNKDIDLAFLGIRITQGSAFAYVLVATAVLFTVACTVWNIGLKKYEPTGT